MGMRWLGERNTSARGGFRNSMHDDTRRPPERMLMITEGYSPKGWLYG
jgi:hypothetical protein